MLNVVEAETVGDLEVAAKAVVMEEVVMEAEKAEGEMGEAMVAVTAEVETGAAKVVVSRQQSHPTKNYFYHIFNN